ncbi:hypothetical protein ACIF8T_36655 [Streptomyces sp. NPDC085946]|uniref:hypothetical protein n=1 Tax=Streptomyces sp. NPDC085946 TaxID=3365744 RepID=UPI0037D124CA
MTRIITDISVPLDGFVTEALSSPDNGPSPDGKALQQRRTISASPTTHLAYDVLGAVR